MTAPPDGIFGCLAHSLHSRNGASKLTAIIALSCDKATSSADPNESSAATESSLTMSLITSQRLRK